MELGTAEVVRSGADGLVIACGTLLRTCLDAAKQLAGEGLEIGVINARFVKPLDQATLLPAMAKVPFVLTVEEGVLMGGFGSAVLEAAADAASKPRCAGWAFPTASSNTARGPSCLRTWASMATPSPKPVGNWPVGQWAVGRRRWAVGSGQ